MKWSHSPSSVYCAAAVLAFIGGACAKEGGESSIQEVQESIGFAEGGPDGKGTVEWQRVPRGTIQKMINARFAPDNSVPILPVASAVQQCASMGIGGHSAGPCNSCQNSDMWIFDGEWFGSSQNGVHQMICLRSTPWPWDYLPGATGSNGDWGQLAKSLWAPDNSNARFDCSGTVLDPRDQVSKVIFGVSANEKMNIPCSGAGFSTTWTRIPAD